MTKSLSSAFPHEVMISSTTLDLPDHRKAALEAINRIGWTPIMMEHSTAESNSDAITYSLKKVEESQIYVGIFGERYGYIPDDLKHNPDRLSITEMEYRHAKKTNKRILIFLPDESHVFTRDQIDKEPEPIAKQERLVEELKEKEVLAFFKNPDSLSLLLYQALNEEKDKLTSINPSPSSFSKAKYNIKTPPQLWAVPPYTLTNKFIGRSAELENLNAWAVSENRIMVVEGIGGLGKSALTWEWVNEHASQSIDNLHGRLWWSFYEQTSLQEFTRYALAYLTQQDPDEVGRDYHQNARRLLIELNTRPSLLVLDGLERVLTAYHRWDKAQQRDDQIATHLRGCTNPADEYLLRIFTHATPSKILITSRLFPRILENTATNHPIPGVVHHKLGGLSKPDALAFIENNGIHGSKNLMLRFAERFGRHSLVLKIICGMINHYRRSPRNFDTWLADPDHGGSLKLDELDLRQTKTHILAFALSGLEDRIRKLLHILSVLPEDIDYNTIQSLNPFLPPEMIEPIHIKDSIRWNHLWDEEHKRQMLSDYDQQYQEEMRDYKHTQEKLREAVPNFDKALGELEERGLLQWDRDTNRYNMHPVVRGYAGDKIKKDDKEQAFKVARDHFGALPKDDLENATELEQVSTSMYIYYCLIGGGLFDEAIKFYREKLANVILYRMELFAIVVEQLEPLFDGDLKALPKVTEASDQGWILGELARVYDEIGLPDLAMEMVIRSLKIHIDEELWVNVSTNLATLCNIYGRKQHYEAENSATTLIRRELSEAIGDKNLIANAALFQAGSAIRQGKFEEGEHFLQECDKDFPNTAFWTWVNQFYQGKATESEWLVGFKLAKKKSSFNTQQMFLSGYALWQLELNLPQKALEAIDQALYLAHKMGKSTPRSQAIRAWALACLDRRREAESELFFLDNDKQRYFAAQAWLVLGERNRAIECVLEAYRNAWGAGPPYIDYYGLDRSRKFLEQMGEPIPELSPFDSSKVSTIPWEKEIREGIEHLKDRKTKQKLEKFTNPESVEKLTHLLNSIKNEKHDDDDANS